VVAGFKELVFLDASENILKAFPETMPPKLEQLLLSTNRLFYSVIPDTIGELSALTRLDLSNNQLE
jgi:Leucine-rich repeat (LRR) protein